MAGRNKAGRARKTLSAFPTCRWRLKCHRGHKDLVQMKMEGSLTAFPTGHFLGSVVMSSSGMAAARALTHAVHHRMTRAREQRKQTNPEEKPHKLSVEVP